MQPYQKQKEQFTLSAAATHSMVAKVKCTMCRAAHLYLPDDVQVLCGDIAIYQVASWFRCEKCDTREWMTANWAASKDRTSARPRSGGSSGCGR